MASADLVRDDSYRGGVEKELGEATMGTRTSRLMLCACAGMALLTPRAEAFGGDRTLEALLYSVPVAIEIAIPDVRLELAGDARHAVLSWPVHVRLYEVGGSRQTEHTTLAAPRFELSAFLEPQLALNGLNSFRGVAGTRVFGGLPVGSALIALVIEGGGLLGADGHGGFAGAGLAFGTIFDRNYPYLALVGRQVWTTTGPRVDFALDVVLPLPVR